MTVVQVRVNIGDDALRCSGVTNASADFQYWVVLCPKCRSLFRYSEIVPRSPTLPYDPLWPAKPELPDGGEKLTCPACQKTSTFQRFELLFNPA
jgi:hypothetical protein